MATLGTSWGPRRQGNAGVISGVPQLGHGGGRAEGEKHSTSNIQWRRPAETPIWGNDGDGDGNHAKTQRFHAIFRFPDAAGHRPALRSQGNIQYSTSNVGPLASTVPPRGREREMSAAVRLSGKSVWAPPPPQIAGRESQSQSSCPVLPVPTGHNPYRCRH